MTASITCPICNHLMQEVFSAVLIKKHAVKYFHCLNCMFLKTEEPWWLDEAYSDAIAITDTGLVARNIQNADILEPIINLLAGNSARIVDVGGGYGLLTRLLRDKGFNCYSYDKYCKNIFAPLFEPDESFSADLILAFELMEHIVDPVQSIGEFFSKYGCKNLVFSTLTYRKKVPDKSWWYYSFETGQHVSFYHKTTLKMIAEKLGVHYFKISDEYHMFLAEKPKRTSRILLTNKKVAPLYKYYVRKKRSHLSKIWDDHLLAKTHILR